MVTRFPARVVSVSPPSALPRKLPQAPRFRSLPAVAYLHGRDRPHRGTVGVSAPLPCEQSRLHKTGAAVATYNPW